MAQERKLHPVDYQPGMKTFKNSKNEDMGRDPFNQNSNRSDWEKRTTSKGGPIFWKRFRLRFGSKFPDILPVERIAPMFTSQGFIEFNVTQKMVPKCRVLLFYVRDDQNKETVADNLVIDVEDTLENKVDHQCSF